MATNGGISPVDPDEKPKSRKPKDTKFKQQKLPAWQPILTANTVLPALFAIGVAFIPLGVALFVTSENIKEFVHDYTYCDSMESPGQTCNDYLKNLTITDPTGYCTCEINFTLDEDFSGTVYMYYGLTNFYQNHRRYVRSRDDVQLHGETVSPSDLNDDCDPFKSVMINGSSLGIAPCGAIANSLFNDSFTLNYTANSNTESVGLLDTGIAWVSDKNVKFNNPSSWQNGSVYEKPINWANGVWDLGSGTNNGYKNEDLIVWMRTAALPTFRKLYRRINHSGNFINGLPVGNYKATIIYRYPVSAFDGTKSLILTTTSWLGGKNPFLGIAYLVVGILCILLGVVLLIIHLKWGKRPGDVINVSNRESY